MIFTRDARGIVDRNLCQDGFSAQQIFTSTTTKSGYTYDDLICLPGWLSVESMGDFYGFITQFMICLLIFMGKMRNKSVKTMGSELA